MGDKIQVGPSPLMPDVERKSKQRLQAQLARVAQAVHSLDPTSLQTVVASLTELGQVGSRFPFSLISRVVRVCSTGASADAERIAHNLCICTTSVYTACQAVQEEQQAQRHLLGETLKVVTDTVQQAAAERQQKAEVNAFHEELLVSSCISSEARHGLANIAILKAIETSDRWLMPSRLCMV